jgi:hypothetical protein
MKRVQGHACDLHGLRMEVWGPEEIVKVVADRFVDFPPGRACPPDLQFVFDSVKSPELHQILRPEGPSRPFYQTDVGKAAYFPTQDLGYIQYGPRASVWFRPASGECRISILQTEAGQLLWLATHPLLNIPLQEMLKRRGKYPIHAAGVARNGRSLLLPGTSGAGKSTLTIALLRAGFDLLSDDLILLEPDDGLKALGFPEKIKATHETLLLFAELNAVNGAVRQQGWPKYLLRASGIYSSSIAWRTVPAAIVFPTIVNQQQSVLSPLSTDEAFIQLSSSVLLTETKSTRSHLSILAEVCRTTPAYRLQTGRDFDRVGSLLGGLLR